MQSAPKHSQTLAGVWLNKFSILLHYTYYMQKKTAIRGKGYCNSSQWNTKKKTKEWTTRERQNNGTTESVALQGASASISQLVYI